MDLQTPTSLNSPSPPQSQRTARFGKPAQRGSDSPSVAVQNATELALQEQKALLASLEKLAGELAEQRALSDTLAAKADEESLTRQRFERDFADQSDSILEAAQILARQDDRAAELLKTHQGDGGDLSRTLIALANRAMSREANLGRANEDLQHRLDRLEAQARKDADTIERLELQGARRAATPPPPASDPSGLMRTLIKEQGKALRHEMELIAKTNSRPREDDLERRLEDVAWRLSQLQSALSPNISLGPARSLGAAAVAAEAEDDRIDALLDKAERIYASWEATRRAHVQLCRRRGW